MLRQQVCRHGQGTHRYRNSLQPAGHHIDESRHAFGIGDRHIEHAGKHVTHGFKRHGDASSLGLQQMKIGRLLRTVLFCGETRAFNKTDNRSGHMAEFFASLARGLQILAGAGAPAPAHERIIQRPPGNAQQGHIQQLLFDEELQKRNAAIECLLQYQNIHPTLMVANQQVPTPHGQVLWQTGTPAQGIEETHPPFVAHTPVMRQRHEHAGAEGAQRLDRQQFEQDEGNHHAESDAGICHIKKARGQEFQKEHDWNTYSLTVKIFTVKDATAALMPPRLPAEPVQHRPLSRQYRRRYVQR